MKAVRVGECIYCGTQEKPLGREHMIAQGLNGPWVLTEASCRSCEKITSAFEGHVLGPVFRPARASLRMKMGKRPTTLPLLIDRGDGDFVTVDLPVEEYPAVVQFPEFLPPAYLDGRAYTGGIQASGVRTIQVAGPPADEVARRLGAKSMRWTTTFTQHTFLRFIAKIAYTFVVADIGLNGIESTYVIPAILGRSDDVGRWAGCDGVEYITEPGLLHGVSQLVANGEVVVRVRLFARYRAPEYAVVVGRLRPEASVGKFKVSGSEGFSRTRSVAEVQATAQQAPEPFIPANHSVSVKMLRPEGKKS